jgi:WD40 repeat protein/DNA-binding SARP family transcriptional activator
VSLEIEVLGRVDLLIDGRAVPLGGSKQRAVLAMLALRANHTVSTDELIDGLWGEGPPASAAKNVQLHVSRLRKAFGTDGAGARIVTRGRGYELQVAEDAVDATRFERLVEEAAREPSGAAGANGAAGAALELWHGAPLADVASEPFASAEVGRLEELHLRAIELAIDAELAAGRHSEVIARLEELIAEEPLRERFHAQRMLALYRDGRQSEALEAYRTARGTLIEQIGVEPGPELQRLQAGVLAHDPSLDAPPPIVELPVQLEGGSPLLAGRERELSWLRRRWEEARAGRVVCALVWGPAGIGKTRLVAELAAEVQRAGAAVLYAGGGQVSEAALGTVAEAGQGHRPKLLVLDYADDAPPAVLEAAARLAREPEGRPLLICVLHHDEQGPPAFAALPEGGAAQRLRLDPLGEDAAAEIAELYASAEGVDIPVRTLIAESEGVPLRIHRAAGEWARAEAAERLSATAGNAADDRTGLRAAQAKIAGGVVDLQTASERTRLYAVDEPPDSSDLEICPFRGLAPFDAAHAEYFFGRERLVAELVARLVGSTLLAVVGPSGSGKSSAMRAGLLPALADGVVPGSEGWRYAVMRPGERPLVELSRTLARAVPETGSEDAAPSIADALELLPAGERLVLAVDQFEEVFVACRDQAERAAFLDALVEGAADQDERLVVVVAIRADFYGRCAEHADLATLLSANQVLVGPMRRDELRRTIELPARRVGLRVEPRLVSALVGDVAGEPGGLPLLSAALLELWQHRDGRTLRHHTYEASGGVEGAVARLAEDAYQRLDTDERRRARPMLLRLAGDDEGAEALVRRRVPLDELELERDQHTARVLAVLTESRLLTVDEGAVEVAHEALLSQWPRLRGWLQQDAEGRRLHHHLIGAAREWRDSERDPAELYRGARLASALDWAAEHDPELNELERAFLEESRAASEREAERQRRAVRRLRTLLAGVGVLLAAAVVAGVIAISERQEARSAVTTEAAQRLGAEGLTSDRLDTALRLAGAGLALDDSVATRSNLLSTLLRSPAAIGVFRGDGDPLLALGLSPDGRTLATGDQDGTVLLFDAATGRRIGNPYQAPEEVGGFAFDPRGHDLMVLSGDSGPQIVDIATQRRVRTVDVGEYPGRRGVISGFHPAYAPDGRSLIVMYWGAEFTGAQPVFLRRLDARTGAQLGQTVRIPAEQGEDELVASPDGRHLFVTSPHATYAIDAATLDVTRRYGTGSPVAAASPDGRTLALGGRDAPMLGPFTGSGTVRLLDMTSGRVRKLAGRHDAPVVSAAFSPDGRTLATTGDDGKVILWDVRGQVARETLGGHSGRVWGAAFSPDGRTLYTASDDGSVIAWDTTGHRGLGRGFRTELVNRTIEQFPPAVALSPDGRTLAVGRLDGAIELIDAGTLQRSGGFAALGGRQVLAIEYSPDGRTLAVAGGEGAVGLFDARSGKPMGPRIGSPPHGDSRAAPALLSNIQALSLSPDGRLLATVSIGGVVRLWDVRNHRAAAPPMHVKEFATGLDFSPDGAQLAVATGFEALGFTGRRNGGIDVRDWRTGRRIALLPMENVREATFSPDGTRLVGGQSDGKAVVWSTEDWQRVGSPLAGHSWFVLKAAFSPDGRTLATSGGDGTVILWDVDSGEQIGAALPGEDNRWVSTAFSPDGNHLFAVYENGRAIRWEVDPATWSRRACAIAGGGLTLEQWDEIVPERDYLPTCSPG